MFPGDGIPTQQCSTCRHCGVKCHWMKRHPPPVSPERSARAPCCCSCRTDHQRFAVFLREGRGVHGTFCISVVQQSFEDIFCCACFLDAHCDLYPEFHMLFFVLFLLPLWPFCSGCSVIVHCVWGWTRANPWSRNRRKHLSGIKLLSSPYHSITASKCTDGTREPRAPSSHGHTGSFQAC